MKLIDQQRAEYTELADYLQSENPAAAEAIRALLADLEEAEYDLEYWKDESRMTRERRLIEDLTTTRKQLAEAQAFIRNISEQGPEKPDHWSSCGQCSHNASDAEDFLNGNGSVLSAAIEAAVEPYKPLVSVVMYQFLSDVITSAGLLSHGKIDKGLAERINGGALMFMGVVAALSAKGSPR